MRVGTAAIGALGVPSAALSGGPFAPLATTSSAPLMAPRGQAGSAASAPADDAAAGAATLKVAQLNVWNMFDTDDGPSWGDDFQSPADYAARLEKLSLTIREGLGSPDLLTLQEVENQQVLDDLLKRPEMQELGYRGLVGASNDQRGIRVGLIYRDSVLESMGVESPNTDMEFPDGGDGQIDTGKLYARPPLVVDFRLRGAAQAAEGAATLTVAVNHFKSKLGGEVPEARRQAQGEWLGTWMDERAKARPGVATMVVGDLNATYEDGAYKKLANRADGTVRFTDAIAGLDDEDRYTYVYRGQKNLLDHVLMNDTLAGAMLTSRIDHLNSADGGRDKKLDPTTPIGMSDHDPIMVEFDLAKLGAAKPAQ